MLGAGGGPGLLITTRLSFTFRLCWFVKLRQFQIGLFFLIRLSRH